MLARDFGPEIEVVMSFALDEACQDLPNNLNSHQCRSYVAQQIIKCAASGEASYDALIECGRATVAEMVALRVKSA